MKRTLPHRFLFILILPLIVLIASFISRYVSGPFWQYGDSSYNYLFNAYQLVKGLVPTEIEHPGTPLQVLIAFSIGVFNLGSTAAVAVDHALIDPEFYLQAVFVFLTLLSFLTSIMLGVYVYRKTNDKIAVLLAQITGLSFLVLPSFDSGTYPVLPVVANVNAEPCFIIVMNLFNMFILGLYFSKNKSQEFRYVLLLAFVCGLGLATKLNFLFILLAALMIVPLRKKFLFLVVFALSFVFWTMPIIPRYPLLFHWITDIVTHSARYGTGTEKFIDWKSFLFYLDLTIRFDWFFVFSALGIWVWSSIRLLKDHRDRGTRFIWVLSFISLVHIVTTAKHFSFHYLLPGFALFGSILPLFYLYQIKEFNILKSLALVFILVFISTCAYYSVPYYKKLLVLTQDINNFSEMINIKYPGCTIIPSTAQDVGVAITKQEAMLSANGTTFRLEGDDLLRLYPQSYYFFSEQVTSPDPNVESYGIWNYKQRVFGDDIMNTCPCAIFIKYGPDFSDYPYQVRLVDQLKYLNAFLLLNSTEKEANILFAQALDAYKKGDLRQAMMLGLKSRQLNYQPRGQLEYILTIIYQNLLKSGYNLSTR